MEKEIHIDSGKKVLPVILMAVGAVLAVSLLFMRLNIVAVVAVAFNCIMSALITLSFIIKKKVYTPHWIRQVCCLIKKIQQRLMNF